MWLTRLDENTLIRYGTRYRTRYLVEQGRYTLKLAHSEPIPLDLRADYLSGIEEKIARVEGMRDDRELMAVESKLATSKQNTFAQEGKIWRRKVTTRAHRAARLGAKVPEELLRVVRTSSVPKLLENMATMVRLLSEFAVDVSAAGDVKPLIEEGKRLHDALASADADQEHKRIAELPASVRALYRDRGELYVALKVVNDAGRERHIRDAHRASRYNLGILYRRGARHGEPEEVAPEEAT